MKATIVLLTMMFLLIGCAKKRPYDSLEMPDKQIFAKSLIFRRSGYTRIWP